MKEKNGEERQKGSTKRKSVCFWEMANQQMNAKKMQEINF